MGTESDNRQEITNMRVEGARSDAEASSARDQLSSLLRETENQVSFHTSLVDDSSTIGFCFEYLSPKG